MIITEIIGGLGNQMFQYAIGRSLSIKLNTGLMMDLKRFDSYPLRNFQLDGFNIHGEKLDVNKFNYGLLGKGNYMGPIRNLFGNSALSFYFFNERQFHYDSKVEELKGNVYLRGYWQSEKYFLPVADQIRNDFKVKTEPNSINKKYIDLINGVNSIALHVRRGDYVTVKKTRESVGTCSLDYYRKGIRFIEKMIDNPHFFVFSDDPDWCKENIEMNSPVDFVIHNSTEKAYEDLRLMKNCKHFVISNSTFSWWGAWLSRNKNKMVIAPKKWFRNKKHITKDLVPREWKRM